MSAGDFLAMGGYGFYVWGSYIVAVVAIAIEVAAVRARLNAARRMPGNEELHR
jgi:heme exporter protein D